jgi:hypothetical protein
MTRVIWCATLLLALAPTLLSAESRIEPALTVAALLRSQSLSDSELSIVRTEAARLWKRYGVTLTWSNSVADAQPSPYAVLVIVSERDSSDPAGGPPALGSVMRVGDAFMRRIIVSRPAIHDFVQHTTGVPDASDAFRHLNARMIGRVIAHELGHLLLNSSTHSPFGMMRQSFGSADVRADDLRRFTLQGHELELLTESVRAIRSEAVPGAGVRAND